MNLTNKQEERGAKETVARLEKLTRKHLESKEIALEYRLLRSSLLLLTGQIHQAFREFQCDFLALRMLPGQFLQAGCRLGLVNLSNKKEKGETKEAVARLEKLTGEHPESKEIALEFAKGS